MSYPLIGYLLQTVVLDGGELPFMAGQFNQLLHHVKKEDWDNIEKTIRETNAKDKKK